MSATLTFSWSKPTSLASCTDCSFEYKYALNATSLDGITPTPVSFGTLSVTIPGLVNGESYHYAVRTICGPVQSKWSYGTTVVCDTPPVDTPTPTPTAVVQTPTPTPTAVVQTPTPTPTPTAVVQTPTPTPTPTAVPDTNYEFLLCYDPNGTALSTYVASFTKLTNGGFTGEPLYSDTIGISGSSNVDAVYQYNGTTTSAVSVPIINAINEYDCSGDPIVPPTPTPTPTAVPPLAEFSVSYGSNSSSSGTGTSNYSPIITVTNGTALIRLSVQVQTGYQGDTTLTVPGSGSYSPTAAQGAGNTTYIEFNLGVGVYNCTWTVSAISDGSLTVATSTLSQQ